MPKLIFRRSWLYDEALIRERDFKMPSDTILNAYLRKIEREWKKQGARILKEVARVTKLEWREKEIVIYITAGVYPYSDPMTLNPRSSIHTLSHELIHRILSEPENREKIKKNWAKLMKKYKGGWKKILPQFAANRKPNTDVVDELSKRAFAKYKRNSRADYSAVYDKFSQAHPYLASC